MLSRRLPGLELPRRLSLAHTALSGLYLPTRKFRGPAPIVLRRTTCSTKADQSDKQNVATAPGKRVSLAKQRDQPKALKPAAAFLAAAEAIRQLEERRASHTQASSQAGKPGSNHTQPPATELIFRLDRRGVGWGEEILPHLTVEQRVLKRNRSAQPDPWTVHPSLLVCLGQLTSCL